MGRKIKSVILLVIMLALIYWQHSEIIYAEDTQKTGETLTEEGTDDQTDSGQEGEGGKEEEKEEEKEEIQRYEVTYEKPDGRNGYYITTPEIKISHVSQRGKTVYHLQNGGETKAEGELENKGAEVVLSGEQFGEGSNILSIYMEDEGERIEEYNWSQEFLLDTVAPAFSMNASAGFDTWYQEEAWLYVAAGDEHPGSGMESISCYCGNEIIGTVEGDTGEFLINYASVNGEGVNVTVTVVDKAGHRSEQTRKMYIDNSAPRITIEGVRDYMITSQPTLVTCKVTEDNHFKECEAEVEWEDPEGKKQMLEGEWTEEGGRKMLALTLEKDGIYRMKMSVSDMAGYQTTQEMQVILDMHDPMIHYVDELNGKYMQIFRWDYGRDVFIQDFTSYVYQMQLDGRPYTPGETIDEEGRHMLRVEVIDAAGNQAEARAGFVVDRTPPQVLFLDIEEGGIYEEETSFKVALQDTEDEVQEIRINGVPKSLEQKSGIYEYTVQENKNYEIVVKACDRAGNETVSRLMFEVVPKETLLEKAVKPIQKIFRKEKVEPESVREEPEGHLFLLIFLGVVIVGIVVGIVVWLAKKWGKRNT